MTQQKINALEARQNELVRIMSSSDAHAAKCAKLGTSFAEEYPDELTQYRAANEEYNRNEVDLAELYAQRDAEAAAAAAVEHVAE